MNHNGYKSIVSRQCYTAVLSSIERFRCVPAPHQGLQLCTGPLWSGLYHPGRPALVGSIAHTFWAAAAWALVDPATGSLPSWWQSVVNVL